MTTYIYIDARPDVIAPRLDRFEQPCEIVAAVPDPTDPSPDSDWYRVRFADGVEFAAAPEELNPIPPPGTAR